MNVILSIYACEPNKGSEKGLGWNYAINLSNYCQLFILTEKENKIAIEDALESLTLKYRPIFYYIDIGSDRIREMCWNQGDWRFYYFYNRWQKQALKVALSIASSTQIDLIHQLNMIGYREPGYLWKIPDVPFVWGPVGGLGRIPLSFLKKFPRKVALFYLFKNILNGINLYNPRLKKVASRSDLILSATKEGGQRLENKFSKKIIVFNETGASPESYISLDKDFDGLFKIIWVGKILARKELNLAIEIIAEIKKKTNKFEFHIVGDGVNIDYSKELSKKLEVDSNCIWHGFTPRKEVIRLMKQSDVNLFTSLDEGTPHVVLESLSVGLPVICHDACGQGSVIDVTCGVKVPVKNPEYSKKEFCEIILNLINNSELLEDLRNGAKNRANALSWENKALELYNYYIDVKNYE